MAPQFILTYTGKLVYPLSPRHEDLEIEDIAHALSNICRFTGHSREHYCPTEDQRVLTADLRWVPAGDLVLGQELLAFDEYPSERGAAGNLRRRFRHTRVTHLTRVKRRTTTLEVAGGKTVTCSDEHPWLVATKMSRNQTWCRTSELAEALKQGRNRYMHQFVDTWGSNESYLAGWLAGMYDGEGYVSCKNRGGVQLGIAQKRGDTLGRIKGALGDLGFGKTSALLNSTSGVETVQMRGGWREVFRLLGTIRPERLVAKIVSALRCGEFNKQMDGNCEPPRITGAYDNGEQWVVGIETGTHTYLCEGFAAHNSVAQHCVLASRHTHGDPLWALLHDAAEAYTGDISRPFKQDLQTVNGRSLDEVEEAIMFQMALRYGLTWPRPACVKEVDDAMLRTEFRDVMRSSDAFTYSKPGVRFIPEQIVPVSAQEAKAMFMERYKELMR
jgi:hypothetical protein